MEGDRSGKQVRGQPTFLPLPENFARKWCSMLTESSGVFSACHATVSPVPFYSVSP